ncbi:MAG: methionine gamma-lyase family protein [Clostridia bacterium]|nr:methionine gamma-lyase family protein [Clostridia bacterium]
MFGKFIRENYGVREDIYRQGQEVEAGLEETFKRIDAIRDYNQIKVLKAMQDVGIAERHFGGSSGYGYDDIGRDAIDEVYAKTFGAESAVVRSQIVSGTHCLCTALFGVLRPGDELLAVTGKPYDTLDTVIGIRPGNGSLKEFGVIYKQVDLKENGEPDYDAIYEAVNPKTKVVLVQRSRGYCYRPAMTLAQIQKISETVKNKNKSTLVFTDNCYGEFVDVKEPTQCGADFMAGSLIKNPGGGLALSGGYIAGREDIVDMCGERITAPGLGKHLGASQFACRNILQGFYFAPHIVAESLKGAAFASAMVERAGIETSPKSTDVRSDIVQCIKFNDPELMKTFCRAIQAGAPVDSFVIPEAAELPGYDDKVIMAAGAFVQGSSIELSADGPMREPYIAYMQGGLTYANVKLAVLIAMQEISKLM